MVRERERERERAQRHRTIKINVCLLKLVSQTEAVTPCSLSAKLTEFCSLSVYRAIFHLVKVFV